MTTAIDTNVIVALWDSDHTLNSAARSLLTSALERGGLTVAAPVFAELLAFRGRDEAFLNVFFKDTGITIDWRLDEAIWRTAGRAFRAYASRRRRYGNSGVRRILADFVIGAHATENAHPLLTLDDRFYRTAFPRLHIVRV
jgi:predicted nucleic acid-binding protein